MLYGPAIIQSDSRKPNPYQLPYNNVLQRRNVLGCKYESRANTEKHVARSYDAQTKRSLVNRRKKIILVLYLTSGTINV